MSLAEAKVGLVINGYGFGQLISGHGAGFMVNWDFGICFGIECRVHGIWLGFVVDMMMGWRRAVKAERELVMEGDG